MNNGIDDFEVIKLANEFTYDNYLLMSKTFIEKNKKTLEENQILELHWFFTKAIINCKNQEIAVLNHNAVASEHLAQIGLKSFSSKSSLLDLAFNLLGRVRTYHTNWEWFETKHNRKIVPTKNVTDFDYEKDS